MINNSERCLQETASPISGNLDFDARVPIPISIFPSTYRNDGNEQESTTRTRVEGEVDNRRVGREDRYTSFQLKEDDRPRRTDQIDIRSERYVPTSLEVNLSSDSASSYRDDRDRRDRRTEVDVDINRDRDRRDRRTEVDVDINRDRRDRRTEVDFEVNRDRDDRRDRRHETEIDVSEREARHRFRPGYDVEVREEYERRRPREHEDEHRHRLDMGYYDDEGRYHSFRRGLERAADRITHPFGHRHDEEIVIERDRHHHHRDRDERRTEVDIEVERDGHHHHHHGEFSRGGYVPSRHESMRFVERRGYGSRHTITIPCHHIRIGDLLILQGRPCQVIRITTSPQTGQHRYLGVDLFTKQLHEESSFSTNPSPSVYVQNMLGPVFKQYRVLDIRDDGYVTAMTENGDVKQSLPVIDHGGLWHSLTDAFSDGRGSVRVQVINDGGRELAVDYKVIHGSRL